MEIVRTAPVAGREFTRNEAETLIGLLSSARSENTNLAYGRAWARFCQWANQTGFTPFPAAPATVALYLNHLNKEGRKVSTLSQHVAAITAAHHDGGHAVNFFKNRLVASALKAAKRDMARDGRSRTVKPRAFNQQEILSMVRSMDNSAQGKRDRAILLLGMNAGLRASEFAFLLLSDVAFDDHGMDVHIRSSKTDQFGQGEMVYVASLAPAQREFDAVAAMRDWMDVRQHYAKGDESLFIAFRKGGSTPHLDTKGQVHGITRQSITDTILRVFKSSGLTGREPSSHSLRHSFITQGFRKQLDASRIAKVSRHKNLRTLMGYDQTSRKQNPVSPSLWV